MPTGYQDEQRRCADCSQPFIYTARSQQFNAAMNFVPPRRCRVCREARKQQREQQRAAIPPPPRSA